MKLVWIDIESDSLDHETGHILELAALYEDTNLNYQEHGDKAKALFHKFCNPYTEKPDFWDVPGNDGKTITERSPHLTWERIQSEGISENDLYKEFLDFLAVRIENFNKHDKAVFAAYNAKFYNQFIRELWKRNDDKYFESYFLSANLDILSTVALAIARGVMPPLIRHSLDVVCDHLGIELKDAHAATSDIIASRKAQLKLEKLLGIR